MTQTIQNGFRETLKKALAGSFDKNKQLSSEEFFSKWFRQKGTPYFFLFKKNLSHTSMQYAEIISLIRVHTVNKSEERHKLNFIKVQEFIDHWRKLFEEQLSSYNKYTNDELIDVIIDLYEEALSHIVAIELFFGSCTIFIPPHLTLHLFETCSESGYIHSCGSNVYTRSLDKANPDSLIKNIKKHIAELKGNKRIYLAVYAHEDFRKEDPISADDLRGGLDDTKIYVEKYYLGDDTFVSFLSRLQTELGNQIVVQGPGDYREKREEALCGSDLDRDRTLWLIVDKALSSQVRRFPGEERFIICYDQHYKNSNPFHIFDENKPAWVAHTTIPHKLAAAMINITRPWWPTSNVQIADPFAGSGTIGLECLKFPYIKPVECSDIAPISVLLGEDNLEFFAYPTEKLEIISKALVNIVEGNISKIENFYTWARATYEKVKPYMQNPEKISSSIIKELRGQSFICKLFFYLFLRTGIRHFNALERSREDIDQAYKHEAERLLDQVKKFIAQRKKEEKSSKRENKCFIVIEGRYSLASSIDPDVFKKASAGGIWRIREQDATSKFEKNVDVIITDPPYGFNTKEDIFQLAKTYTMALRSMINRLNDGGQLVICLPDKSYTGRKIPVFSTSEWLIQQILAEAQTLGFEAIVEAQVLPQPTNLFRPPYYWESERALRRNILHFRFRSGRNPQ
ncbi:MAG: hypothetical protein Q6358_04150 [Candidatus Brocadiales bacterium]|nr:hypothetical protein [Candidatus Brocadiales bacterium]